MRKNTPLVLATLPFVLGVGLMSGCQDPDRIPDDKLPGANSTVPESVMVRDRSQIPAGGARQGGGFPGAPASGGASQGAAAAGQANQMAEWMKNRKPNGQ
jgi:hypothetical protein